VEGVRRGNLSLGREGRRIPGLRQRLAFLIIWWHRERQCERWGDGWSVEWRGDSVRSRKGGEFSRLGGE
jgi:hypothetical protein